MIVEGRLRVHAGHGGVEATLAELRPGDVLGEMQLLTGGARSANAVAHTVPKVMLQLATLGDLTDAHERAALADYVLGPPVKEFSMLDLDRLDAIVRAGYEHTLARGSRGGRQGGRAAGSSKLCTKPAVHVPVLVHLPDLRWLSFGETRSYDDGVTGPSKDSQRRTCTCT